MHFSKPLPEGRKSYSVPKQELRSTRCFTTLNVKRTVHEPACDDALDKLRYALARHLSKNNTKVPVSTENKLSGNWIALVMPDAVPSRLGLMTRIASLVTMYSQADNGLALNNAARDTLNQSFAKDLVEALPTIVDGYPPPKSQRGPSADQTAFSTIFEDLVESVLCDLLSTDHVKGLEVLYAWRRYYHKSSIASPVTGRPTSLDDYLHNSTQLFPENPWMATLRYALGLHLQDTELRAIEPAITAAMQSVALTRDYWAWPKDSCSTNNSERLKNAVSISMVERQCSEVQGMAVVKDAAIATESRFLERRRGLLEAMGKKHTEIVMVLDAVEHFAAGNSLWCSSCPLYHRGC
jgi:hypothetical protein